MKLDTKDYIVAVIIIVLALGAGLFSAYQYIDGVKKDKEDKERAEQLSDAQGKALKATEQISTAQEKALKATSELKDEQKKTIIKAEELIAAQNKINELQDKILKQSESQGKELSNIGNPIPSKFELDLGGQVILNTKQELKILKELLLHLKIIIQKNDKEITILYDKKMNIANPGDDADNLFYIPGINGISSESIIWAKNVTLEKVGVNHTRKTLNDFTDAKVFIEVWLSTPGRKGPGRDETSGKPFLITIEELSLYDGTKQFEIKELKNTGFCVYTGVFSF